MRRVKTPEQLKAWREKDWKPLGWRGPIAYVHVSKHGTLDLYARDLAEDPSLRAAVMARFEGDWGKKYDYPYVKIAGEIRKRN
jgi:hypothetical protein